MNTTSSLSDFYPKDTEFFYGYCTGLQSGFLDLSPGWGEELAASRPIVCAGQHIKVVSLANGTKKSVLDLFRTIEMPICDEQQIIPIHGVDTSLVHEARDLLVEAYLKKSLSEGRFIMAQPYPGPLLDSKYLIPKETTLFLNDKKNLAAIIPAKYLAKKYHSFESGADFFQANPHSITVPSVVKVTNASGGDGVRLCMNEKDIALAQKDFQQYPSCIEVQEYLEDAEDVDIQFGIPPDKNEPAQILGFSRQKTTEDKKYLGGVFEDKSIDDTIKKIYIVLEEEIFPKIRELGWYGVGGIDVLIRKDGSFIFIDGNLRMTATHSYRMHINSGWIKSPCVTMTTTFRGDMNELTRALAPLARLGSGNQILHPSSISEENGVIHVNTALLYDNPQNQIENAQRALNAGFQSRLLTELVQNRGTID